MHKVGIKRIFNELIFTAVEYKTPACDSANISVHVYLSQLSTALLPAILMVI